MSHSSSREGAKKHYLGLFTVCSKHRCDKVSIGYVFSLEVTLGVDQVLPELQLILEVQSYTKQSVKWFRLSEVDVVCAA
jgi:hypothetical protein